MCPTSASFLIGLPTTVDDPWPSTHPPRPLQRCPREQPGAGASGRPDRDAPARTRGAPNGKTQRWAPEDVLRTLIESAKRAAVAGHPSSHGIRMRHSGRGWATRPVATRFASFVVPLLTRTVILTVSPRIGGGISAAVPIRHTKAGRSPSVFNRTASVGSPYN